MRQIFQKSELYQEIPRLKKNKNQYKTCYNKVYTGFTLDFIFTKILQMEPRGVEPLSYYLATNTSTLIVLPFKIHRLHAVTQGDQTASLIILFQSPPSGEQLAQITNLLNHQIIGNHN